MSEFIGKVAVITGGARGFGKAFGAALLERGATVVLLDIDGAAAVQTAAILGENAFAITLDVTDEQAVAAAMRAIAEAHGGIDILINNAGIHSAAANEYIGVLGTEGVRRMFDVNIWGVIYCTLSAAHYMKDRGGASIVNIASMAAYVPSKAYGVSKLAVRGLTVSFANELADSGIRVNAVAPGLIFTETIRHELPGEVIKQVLASQILKREGEESDIVAAVLFLASEKASFVTGETWRVSGGATLQV